MVRERRTNSYGWIVTIGMEHREAGGLNIGSVVLAIVTEGWRRSMLGRARLAWFIFNGGLTIWVAILRS